MAGLLAGADLRWWNAITAKGARVPAGDGNLPGSTQKYLTNIRSNRGLLFMTRVTIYIPNPYAKKQTSIC